ncbi:ABC transporter substrate-binding protein [Devosia sp.]|uniref:ABC transporter substrate-binding protein n=1 Tax=Devosia sp. TaxID=1871048 RepID=UPI00262DFC56|nr:ABC transporter substrate-binding protein [Devosia sp.]
MGGALAQDKVSFGTNWLAQAEHGGYYQAVADGTYAKYNLDVTIRQGGPQGANRSLLIGGQINFYMGGPTTAIDAVKEGIPTLTIASIFQKDPQVLLAHPDSGFETFADLAKASKYILSKDGFISYFGWMKTAYEGFTDDKFEPYTFNPAPFIADKQAIQQGYVTSEPYEIEKQTGWAPKAFLLADNGFAPYSSTIEVMKPWYDANKDVAKRFVEASIIGWYNYLYGDNTAANELIKKDNPDMTDGQLAFGVAKMKEYGLVVSGDAETNGIGCMTDARWKDFYEQMVGVGLFSDGIDYTKAYTTELVCQGVGKELVK